MRSASQKSPVSFGAVWRFMWHYYSQQRLKVVLAFTFSALAAFVSIANPYAYAYLVEVATNVTGARTLDVIMEPVVIIVGLSLFHHINIRIAHFLNCHTDAWVQAQVGADAIKNVHTFESEWHNNTFVGSVVTAIKRGRLAAHRLYDIICYDMWPLLLVMVGCIAFTWQKSVPIALSLVAFAVIFTPISIYLTLRHVTPYNRMGAKADSQLGGVSADSLTGHAVVTSMGAEVREDQRLREVADYYFRIGRNAWTRGNAVVLVQNILINLGRYGSMLLAAYYWIDGTFNAADMVFVLFMQRSIADYLDRIGERLSDMIGAVNDLEEVITWQTRVPSILSPVNTAPVQVREGRVELRDITFTYTGQPQPAVRNINLSVRAGERVALVGHSGSGKSTIFKLLHRQYDAQEGSILVDGRELPSMVLSQIRPQLMLVPQDPILFHRTIFENIAYAKPDATLDEVRAAARAAQIAELVEKLPLQYETLVGERGIKLSGGERQRVAIARAILANAPILLLDEATSALDSECEQEIQAAIAAATRGRTVLAIAHRLSTIQHMDRIIVLNQGQIIEEGSHAQLLALPGGHYRRMYEAQASGFLGEDAA